MIVRIFLSFVFIIFSSLSFALDNPEAPDYVGEFLERAKKYENQINSGESSHYFYASEFHKYKVFLDDELNKSYNLLMGKLDDNSKVKLRASQRAWLAYRDAEFNFINTNFTQEEFGSSYILSRGDYSSSLIKKRVVELYLYLINY